MALIGKVKWFDPRKGYGFIEQPDGSADIFVHYTDLNGQGYRALKEGEKVKYEVSESPKGTKAIRVERVPTEDAKAAG